MVVSADSDRWQYSGRINKCHHWSSAAGRETAAGVQLSLRWLQRYGAVTLLLSWVPIIGDLLCVLAGWLRMPWVPVAFYLSIGKAVRYVALAWLTLQGMSWWS